MTKKLFFFNSPIFVTYEMLTSQLPCRIDCCTDYQWSRPSVEGQVEVEKYVTGHHYSKVTSNRSNKRH